MKLTIFTPTYNRAHTLVDVYKSLLHQTIKDFEWLIVDDGSTDNTKNLVDNWIEENNISIRYFYQQNQGKHMAHNLGVEKANGILFTCLDSDDTFLSNTVEEILNIDYEENPLCCGSIGLDIYKSGALIGSGFPSDLNYASWNELIFKYGMKGDKTITFKTDILREFPFPENKDRHMPPSYQLFLMSGEYKFKLLNKDLKVVEYLEDGITSNIRKQYKKAPHNYMLYRLVMLNQPNTSWKFKFKTAMLYHVAKKYSVDKKLYIDKEKKYKYLLGITKPFGELYYKKINRGV